MSKRRELFVRPTSGVQRRRHKGRLRGSARTDVTCTFTVQRPAEDNPTKETAQYVERAAGGVNQASRLKNILQLQNTGGGEKKHDAQICTRFVREIWILRTQSASSAWK